MATASDRQRRAQAAAPEGEPGQRGEPHPDQQAGADHRARRGPITARRSASRSGTRGRAAPSARIGSPFIWLGDREAEAVEDRRGDVGREHVTAHPGRVRGQRSRRSPRPAIPIASAWSAAGGGRSIAIRRSSGRRPAASARAGAGSAPRPDVGQRRCGTTRAESRPTSRSTIIAAAGLPASGERRPAPASSVVPSKPGTRSAGTPSARARTRFQIGARDPRRPARRPPRTRGSGSS